MDNTTYTVGYNQPGYLPEGEVMWFDDFEEALSALIDVCLEHDELELADAFSHKDNKPGSYEAVGTDGYEYWLYVINDDRDTDEEHA